MELNKSGSTSYFHRKVAKPLLGFISQGVTPKKLALSVAVGVVLGIFPMLGVTTLLAAAIAIIFKLNMPAIQLINYFMYPVQIAAVVPFMKMGGYIFDKPFVTESVTNLAVMFKQDFFAATWQFLKINSLGMVAWAILALPIFLLVYYPSFFIFKKYVLRKPVAV